MTLYEMSGMYTQLFEQFDKISGWEADTNADGQAIDSDGNVIENPDRYKETMLAAWFNTLESIEGEFDVKAESVAAYIKSLVYESDAIKAEEKSLRERRRRCEKSAESLKNYLLNAMQAIGKSKIESPRATIRVRNNPAGLIVDDEAAFINWAEKSGRDELLKYSAPEIRKNDVKALIKSGIEIPFAHTESSVSLIIK